MIKPLVSNPWDNLINNETKDYQIKNYTNDYQIKNDTEYDHINNKFKEYGI